MKMVTGAQITTNSSLRKGNVTTYSFCFYSVGGPQTQWVLTSVADDLQKSNNKSISNETLGLLYMLLKALQVV